MSDRQPHEVTLVRTGPGAAPDETAVIRLIGLLPAGWTCTQQVGAGRIRMLVGTARPAGDLAALPTDEHGGTSSIGLAALVRLRSH